MAEALRLLVDGAEQHVDDMSGAEALARAIDGGQRLDRRLRAVPGLDRLQAGIAAAAIARMRLAEMRKDRLAAARGGLADRQQRVELGALDALDLVGGAPSSIIRRRWTTSAMP